LLYESFVLNLIRTKREGITKISHLILYCDFEVKILEQLEKRYKDYPCPCPTLPSVRTGADRYKGDEIISYRIEVLTNDPFFGIKGV
jgi:hypothetical protein